MTNRSPFIIGELRVYSCEMLDSHSLLFNNFLSGCRWSCPYCSNPLISGLVPSYVLTDDSTDGHGFISIDTNQKTVYIVFRGSHGLTAW